MGSATCGVREGFHGETRRGSALTLQVDKSKAVQAARGVG